MCHEVGLEMNERHIYTQWEGERALKNAGVPLL